MEPLIGAGQDGIDPKQTEYYKQLGIQLVAYREKNPALTTRTVREMKEMVYSARLGAKRRGFDMPKCTLVVFLRMNHVCVWPEELPLAEIQKRLRLFIIHRQRHNLAVDADDLAMGVRRAYPDYSPSRFNLVTPEITKTSQQETMQ